MLMMCLVTIGVSAHIFNAKYLLVELEENEVPREAPMRIPNPMGPGPRSMRFRANTPKKKGGKKKGGKKGDKGNVYNNNSNGLLLKCL